MTVSNIRTVLPRDIRQVWETVTSLEQYAWRSDLGRVEVLSEGQFIEYTKDGFTTTFTVTAMEPCRRWEFDLENANIKGHWRGIFTEQAGQTVLDFTEEVTAKKPWMKPFVKGYLKKQQALYIRDLKKALL